MAMAAGPPSQTRMAEWLMVEEWREVPGEGGWYEVSSLGNVRTWRGGNSSRRRSPRTNSLIHNQTGYLYVGATKDGKRRLVRVHSWVALAFIGPRSPGMTVNHIDGNKHNNAASNLEYMTIGDNVRHAIRLGLTPVGERSAAAKMSASDVEAIRRRFDFTPDFISSEATRLNVSKSAVIRALRGDTFADIPGAVNLNDFCRHGHRLSVVGLVVVGGSSRCAECRKESQARWIAADRDRRRQRSTSAA